MALIKCPECGQEISDKATICPHCGTSIFVCPECGQVSVGSPTMCPKCGYMNAGQKTVVQPKKAETDIDSEVNTDIIGAWLEANPGERKWFGYVIAALRILLFLGALGVFLCIVFFIQIPYETLEDRGMEFLDMVFNYQTYIRNVWILAALICVLILAWGIVFFYGDIWPIRCGRWLRRKKIDAKMTLKNELQGFQNGKFSGYRGVRGYNKYKILNVGRAYVYDMALRKSDNYGLIASDLLGMVLFVSFISFFVLSYAFSLCNLIENNVMVDSQIELFTLENFDNFIPRLVIVMCIFVFAGIVLGIFDLLLRKRARKTIRQALSK